MDVLLSLALYFLFVLVFFLLFYYLCIRPFSALALAIIVSLLLMYFIEPMSRIPQDTPNTYMALYVITILISLLLLGGYVLCAAMTDRTCSR